MANGTNQGVAGNLASIDMYRSYTIPLSYFDYSYLNLLFTSQTLASR